MQGEEEKKQNKKQNKAERAGVIQSVSAKNPGFFL